MTQCEYSMFDGTVEEQKARTTCERCGRPWTVHRDRGDVVCPRCWNQCLPALTELYLDKLAERLAVNV